jgi:hypothetical protein
MSFLYCGTIRSSMHRVGVGGDLFGGSLKMPYSSIQNRSLLQIASDGERDCAGLRSSHRKTAVEPWIHTRLLHMTMAKTPITDL